MWSAERQAPKGNKGKQGKARKRDDWFLACIIQWLLMQLTSTMHFILCQAGVGGSSTSKDRQSTCLIDHPPGLRKTWRDRHVPAVKKIVSMSACQPKGDRRAFSN